MTRTPARPFRSREWFAAPGRSDMAALYLERFMNYGLTPDELRCGKPIIGIAQSGSDLVPCNRHHLVLAERVKRRDTRPLLRDRNPHEVLSDLARVRNPVYALAPIHVASQKAPHEATVAAILRAIGR